MHEVRTRREVKRWEVAFVNLQERNEWSVFVIAFIDRTQCRPWGVYWPPKCSAELTLKITLIARSPWVQPDRLNSKVCESGNLATNIYFGWSRCWRHSHELRSQLESHYPSKKLLLTSALHEERTSSFALLFIQSSATSAVGIGTLISF